MSDEDTIGGDDRHDFTAAEYVLGVLSAEDRRAAEFRMAAEPKFAAEVAYWETRLGGLAESVPAVAPPAKVWAGIEDRLSASLAPPRERAGFWNSLAFWRTFAIASAGLAAASMAGLVYLAQIPSLGPPLLATLDEQSGRAGISRRRQSGRRHRHRGAGGASHRRGYSNPTSSGSFRPAASRIRLAWSIPSVR